MAAQWEDQFRFDQGNTLSPWSLVVSEGVFGITCLLEAEIEVLSLTLKVNFGITCGVFQSNIEVWQQPSGRTSSASTKEILCHHGHWWCLKVFLLSHVSLRPRLRYYP